MADVFISYSNRGYRRGIVRRLATVLRAYDLSVWWDHGLETGENFRDRIVSELDSARVILPLWCEESVKSPWVAEEARTGHLRGVLCPALLQNVPLPKDFETIQTTTLTGWDGTLDERVCRFAEEVCRRAGKPAKAPPDLLEDLKSLPPVDALDTVKEVVEGASFEVYSNYELFGNEGHAGVISATKGPVDVVGISLMSFHRETDQPLGSALGKRAGLGAPIRALIANPDNLPGLSQMISDAVGDGELVRRIADEIRRSAEMWHELARTYPNVTCRMVSRTVIRQIATITSERAVMTPYWYAALSSNERPTLVCRPNSAFYKLIRAEFDALWSVAN